MPVTFTVAQHPAESFTETYPQFSRDENTILSNTAPAYVPTKVLQSSIDGSQNVITQRNGFVQGALLAYNKHHNLIIRINAHAEELRDKFVSHAGKKKLTVESQSTTMAGMDFGKLSLQMSNAIYANVKDATLVPWVLPDFTTTTPDDSVICSVLLMSTLKEYFSYGMMVACGIPAITLEGTRDDWQSILKRIDRLDEFGDEPKKWAGMLRAVLSRFVQAFDADNGQTLRDKTFWEKIIHEEHGSGLYWIGGWMSVFCAWNSKGNFYQGADWGEFKCLELDGHRIPRATTCPKGYAEVDVEVVDEADKTWDCRMLAGHVGISLQGDQSDTIRMAPQWFIQYIAPHSTLISPMPSEANHIWPKATFSAHVGLRGMERMLQVYIYMEHANGWRPDIIRGYFCQTLNHLTA
ncbi:hypothetical protein DXG01_014912 [Tephrocybe rancida]|nr:hypothetical protein DXG01_014912 [Tephrocybe rancida]